MGVLTERGVLINAAPILLSEEKDLGNGANFLSGLKKGQKHEAITLLIDLTKRLRKIDAIKDKKAIYRTYNEKERIVN